MQRKQEAELDEVRERYQRALEIGSEIIKGKE